MALLSVEYAVKQLVREDEDDVCIHGRAGSGWLGMFPVADIPPASYLATEEATNNKMSSKEQREQNSLHF